MKHLLLLPFFLLAAVAGNGQSSAVPFFSADSLQKQRTIEQGWRQHSGDSLAWARPEYSDAHWHQGSSRMTVRGTGDSVFSDIGWFRYAFAVDSSLAGEPLALSLSHEGASEIYLDGKLLHRYGQLLSREKAKYYDPLSEPLVFTLGVPGPHLLAVRYARWGAPVRNGNYRGVAGFDAELSIANIESSGYIRERVLAAGLLIFLFSLFATLGVVHLLIYFYQRQGRRNLLFAVFAACVAAFFLGGFLQTFLHGPRAAAVLSRAEPFLGVIACLALSGFMNALFSRTKRRFRVMAVASVICCALIAGVEEMTDSVPLFFIVVVSVEALVLTIRAVVRRVPGARIIGAGFGLVAFFIVAIAVFVLLGSNRFELAGPAGIVAVLALLIGLLAIPLSMSAYLAWSFATVNKRLKAELIQVETLSEQARLAEEERQRLLQTRQEELEREVSIRTEQLRGEKQKSDDLLLNILPAEIAEELKEKGSAKTKLYNNVTVLFTDFVDFTIASSAADPVALVQEIDDCFRAFDGIVTRHGLEKIKTIGDAYLAVAGLPAAHPDHAAATVAAALEIRDFILARRAENPDSFAIRIGVHSGPVVAGIVGVKKFAYDVWGDTVNTAARMEQSGEAGKVNISGATHAMVRDVFRCTPRGKVAAKGKGEVEMYFAEA